MNRQRIGLLVVLVLGVVLCASCAEGDEVPPTGAVATATTGQPASPAAAPTAASAGDASPDARTSAQLIQPRDLVYRGAFRLPDGPEEIGWAYSGAAMTCYPAGDPDGPADGYPGSIFGTGHDWNQYVSEISIPVPVISPDKIGVDMTGELVRE